MCTLTIIEPSAWIQSVGGAYLTWLPTSKYACTHLLPSERTNAANRSGLTHRWFQTFSSAITTPVFSATGMSFSIPARVPSVAALCDWMYSAYLLLSPLTTRVMRAVFSSNS